MMYSYWFICYNLTNLKRRSYPMEKVKIPQFLISSKPFMKELVKALKEKFEYASILGTDQTGKTYLVQSTGASIADSRWVERGFVVRVYKSGRYYEYSFNQIPNSIDTIVNKVCENFDLASISTDNHINYPLFSEELVTRSFLGTVAILPDALSPEKKLEKLSSLQKSASKYSSHLIEFITRFSTVQVSRVFISDKKDLEQSYIWSEAFIYALVRRGEETRDSYETFSGLKGLEILDELENNIEIVVKEAEALLDAEAMVPGEYDIICHPDATGMIVHEAFGHGVELDMFVKERAKAVEYMDKPVASSLITMRDGAKSAENVASYMFDDEGNLAGDTVVIENGILKAGISDLLSALKLGTIPTGNGRRESFEHKVYTRMTNTFFEAGKDKLEDMIASISHGYYIKSATSGMEDPKDWGIQCMFTSAIEIKDGKLTDRIIAPVIMTGYVPDVLKSIGMVSDGIQLSGSGSCGKGYKEFAKVSSGGSYIKTRARLG